MGAGHADDIVPEVAHQAFQVHRDEGLILDDQHVGCDLGGHLAAGGIGDARGVAAVLALGAQAAWLGTRFLLAAEMPIHEEYRRRLIAEPEIIPYAVEEVLRFYTMIFGDGRKVTRDLEFHGAALRKGDMVYGLVSAANRDPRRWDKPDVFDVRRRATGHMTFGTGIHGCVGQAVARLEEALKRRLPAVAVKVVTLVRSRMSAEDLSRGMAKLLVDEKPDLVIWQTGTLDAIRRIEPDDFRAALEEGVETLHKGGADVILMNMQYSPRTDIMIALGPYADNMRVVAQQHEIPLFDRLAIMRHWSDTGAFDLYAAGKDNVLAHRVHDCIGRSIASMIIDAAHLRSVDSKAGQ